MAIFKTEENSISDEAIVEFDFDYLLNLAPVITRLENFMGTNETLQLSRASKTWYAATEKIISNKAMVHFRGLPTLYMKGAVNFTVNVSRPYKNVKCCLTFFESIPTTVESLTLYVNALINLCVFQKPIFDFAKFKNISTLRIQDIPVTQAMLTKIRVLDQLVTLEIMNDQFHRIGEILNIRNCPTLDFPKLKNLKLVDCFGRDLVTIFQTPLLESLHVKTSLKDVESDFTRHVIYTFPKLKFLTIDDHHNEFRREDLQQLILRLPFLKTVHLHRQHSTWEQQRCNMGKYFANYDHQIFEMFICSFWTKIEFLYNETGEKPAVFDYAKCIFLTTSEKCHTYVLK